MDTLKFYTPGGECVREVRLKRGGFLPLLAGLAGAVLPRLLGMGTKHLLGNEDMMVPIPLKRLTEAQLRKLLMSLIMQDDELTSDEEYIPSDEEYIPSDEESPPDELREGSGRRRRRTKGGAVGFGKSKPKGGAVGFGKPGGSKPKGGAVGFGRKKKTGSGAKVGWTPDQPRAVSEPRTPATPLPIFRFS